MTKKVRKAVRTFIIKDNQILVIKYKTERNKDYYDIPGGKIEDLETAQDASIREVLEETGINILSQEYRGNVIVEYPNIIFDFDIFLVNNFIGTPKEFYENNSMWIDIEKLLKMNMVFPCIEIIKYIKDDNISLKIYSDSNHNILNIEKTLSKLRR